MPTVTANGLQIAYESHGEERDPAVLLIMGLSAQLIMWPQPLIQAMVEAGFRVVAFDNRDVGLSEKLEGRRPPNPLLQLVLSRIGVRMRAPYALEDMAQDAIGLMDALGVAKAHVAGASMGGMIAQILGAEHADRVVSVTPIMTSTNHPSLPRADPKVIRDVLLRRRKATTRDERVDEIARMWSIIGTPGSPAEAAETRARLAATVDRCYYRPGVARQLAAIIASGDLRPYAKRIAAPTLVLHGSIDPLAPPTGGEDVARCAPNGRLEIIEGMAHDLPTKFIPQISRLMIQHMQAAEQAEREQAPA